MCWVRPGLLEAKASCFCCVRVFIQVDLPALERPTNAISGTSSSGKKCSWGAVVRNLAVCNQPIEITAGDFSVAATGGLLGCLGAGLGALVMLVMVVVAGKPKAAL